MKIIAIGDTHGRGAWKRIVAENDFDKVVFLGDYFDTHEGFPAEVQIAVFTEILNYKKQNPDKVALLLGNHDWHYLDPWFENYAGFQHDHAVAIGKLLEHAMEEKLIQMTYVWKQYAFIHAGLTKTWCRENMIDTDDLDQSLNSLFYSAPIAFIFKWGENKDSYGDEITQSPIWVRPQSLLEDNLDNYIQIVGHTPQERLRVTDKVVFIDCLGTSGEYLEIEDGVVRVKAS